jgi:hypothetical protein
MRLRGGCAACTTPQALELPEKTEESMETRSERPLTVVFNSRRISSMVLHQLLQIKAVKVEILRGRLSARTAWFELKLQGEPRAIERVVQYCDPWSVHIPRVESKRA